MPDLLERLKSAMADRYAVEAEVGRGGMAAVFLAEDLKHHRKVAIKVLHPELAATVGPERFLREIEIAAGLDHPHILTLLDSGEADGLLYYVMPYVEGESLRDRLTREGQLPIDEAVRIAREIADGLGHAHRHGVIHRDIKPANIMLSEGHSVIADFGIARAIGGEGRGLTSTGLAVGTPAYMSPEQAGGARELDARSDLYALGCVVYEMLAGEPPLTGPTPQAMAARRLSESATPLPLMRDTVPGGLDSAVARLLAKSPADRPQSAEKFIENLDSPRLWEDPQPRRRVTTWAAGVVVVLLLSAAAVSATSWLSDRGGAVEIVPQRVAVLPFENLTGDPALDYLEELTAERITTRLRQEEVGEPVANAVIDAAGFSEGGEDPVRAVARATGAAVIVKGAIRRTGDTLRFEIRLFDAEAGIQQGTLDLDLEAAAIPDPGLETIGSRLSGGLLLAFDGAEPDWAMRTFPTIESYRVLKEAWTLGQDGNIPKALDRELHASNLDTTFVLPLYYAIGSLNDLGRLAEADSLNRVVGERLLGTMSEAQRYEYHASRAWFDRDLDAAYRAQREVVGLRPDSWDNRTDLAFYCFAINRPREIIEMLSGFEAGLIEDPSALTRQYRFLAMAYHMLGEHESELEAAREVDRLVWSTPLRRKFFVARATAALGWGEDVRIVLDQLESLSDTTFQAGRFILATGLELRYHGSLEESKEVIQRAVRWFEERPERLQEDPGHKHEYGFALYHAERWEDATAVLESGRGPEQPGVDVLGYLGLAAARLGDQDSVARIKARLDQIGRDDLDSRPHSWSYRARIAAIEGDRASAVEHLKRAFDEALIYFPRSSVRLQYRFDFEGMADYGPYRELLRPKG